MSNTTRNICLKRDSTVAKYLCAVLLEASDAIEMRALQLRHRSVVHHLPHRKKKKRSVGRCSPRWKDRSTERFDTYTALLSKV
jgi:hypothetical protein